MIVLGSGDNAILRSISDRGYKLFHQGILELAKVESNGLRIDVPYLKETIKSNEKKVEVYKNKLTTHVIWKTWKKRFGTSSNINSTDQLGKVLFEELDYEPKQLTATGKPKVDEHALEFIDSPFVKKYVEFKKLQKAGATYLKGILKETQDGFLHPVFNLHLVSSFRGSSDNPNFQNLPIRNPLMSELIRKCFVARKDHILGEIDFGSLEVRIAACYHRDPTMITYLTDTSTDMHRDMAMQIFKLKESEVDKKTHRYSTKNKYVFPEFYGDYYINCAQHLWDDIGLLDMKGPDGKPLTYHLKRKGIKRLGDMNPKEDPKPGTFEKHMKEVEKDFWENRFRVYNDWKKEWWEKYQETGSFKMKTGFEVSGIFDRKQVINYPVQGSAFHCLLRCLIQLGRWLRKNKMRSLIVGQIHDSIVLDMHKDEVDDVLGQAKYIMTEWLPKVWGWINVPLEIEAEICPEGGSWYDKKEYEL